MTRLFRDPYDFSGHGPRYCRADQIKSPGPAPSPTAGEADLEARIALRRVFLAPRRTNQAMTRAA